MVWYVFVTEFLYDVSFVIKSEMQRCLIFRPTPHKYIGFGAFLA